MGFLSRFEGKMEDTVEGAAGTLSRSPISPVQIAKKCEKQMLRSKMVGAGKQYAPTLYTVLVNPDDDERLFSFYPTLSGETETYLKAKSSEQGLYMDGQPLVRFIVDDGLRHGKFDVIAEVVASAIIGQLRQEEMERYGIIAPAQGSRGYAQQPQRQPQQPQNHTNQSYDDEYYNDPYANNAYDDPYANNQYDDNYNDQYANDPYEPSNYDDYGSSSGKMDPYAPQTVPEGAAAAAAAGVGFGAAAQPQTSMFSNETVAMPAASVARLIDTTTNRISVLSSPRMVLGRANECDITIPDINASRNHAELIRQNDSTWFVRDLGSKNGTLVNGRMLQQPAMLRDGDRLTIGITELVFTTSGQ